MARPQGLSLLLSRKVAKVETVTFFLCGAWILDASGLEGWAADAAHHPPLRPPLYKHNPGQAGHAAAAEGRKVAPTADESPWLLSIPSPSSPVRLPRYTFFVALQDVEDDMGHTQFLPYTHTPAAHELWNAAGRNDGLKDRFIAAQAAVHSRLRRGDAAAFDSRVLHCGCANDSDKLRVLMYVTISRAQRWPLPDGLHGSNSVREEDRWQWQLSTTLLNS